MSLREKVSRNIGVLRRELTGKSRFVGSYPTPYTAQALSQVPISPIVPWFPRVEMARLIIDEETAHVEYSRMAEHPAIKQNELAHSTILGIADDEKRHAQQLKDILTLLEREKKIV